MTQHALQQITPKQVRRLVLAQLVVTVLLPAVLFLVFSDTVSVTTANSGFVIAYSGLVGGMIASLANAWFAYKVFSPGTADRMSGADAARQLRSMYWGEINKIMLTGALFVTAFVMLDPVNGAALIACYFVVHMTPFVASMLIKNTH